MEGEILKKKFSYKFFPRPSMKKINLIFIFFILNSSFLIHNCRSQSGWFYQQLPILSSTQIRDLKFFDENIGLIATSNPNYILRTSNGGYNWNIVLSNQAVFEFDIIDSTAIYARGSGIDADALLLKSYNSGATWDSLPISNAWTANGISFVNRDTGWIGGTSGGLPYVWQTTNGGLNWTVQSNETGFGKIFFLKNKVNGEYIGWSQFEDVATYKTTNSGVNWFQVGNVGNVTKLQFVDQYTGYAANYNNMRITTNGGLNWNIYYMPSDNGIIFNTINLFVKINTDTIYGDYGVRYFGNNKFRGVIWISTNNGLTWGFQQPDTSINKNRYNGIDFVNQDTGWSSWIRTNDGGGPIIITSVNNLITLKPDDYILEQNYPNPFNSSTRINFSVPRPSYIILELYDISGKRAVTLYNNEFFVSGNYYTSLDISKTGLSSGIYFYRMTATDLNGSITFIQTRKCVYIK